MTRQKKSRKPGSFEAKSDKKKQKAKGANELDKRPKKHKGLSAGTRNNPLTAKKPDSGDHNKANKDPRHGSKKPIALTQASEPAQETVELREFTPQAKLVKAKQPELTAEQELAQIENDARLLELLERKENGELVTGKDAKYFNTKMARHQQLCEILGIDEEDDDEDDDELAAYDSRSLAEQWEDDDWPQDDKDKG